ncbi:MAG: peptide chain release factor N(5)-glutamine methyltransferase [Flavobacteriales bacterium]
MKVPDNTLESVRKFVYAELQSLYGKGELRIIWDALCEVFSSVQPPPAKLSESELLLFFNAVKKLKKGMPYQYVTQNVHFYGLQLFVNEHTLIPRPETEELADMILKKHTDAILNVTDACTGSGCIALALQSRRPQWKVQGFDLFPETLAVAEKNAVKTGLPVSFFRADALDPDTYLRLEKTDILVSNPPYISASEKADMHPNVLDFEPHSALFPEGTDPLLFYRRLAAGAVQCLRKGGYFYAEINQYLPQETCSAVQEAGLSHVQAHKDLSGNWRFVSAQYL